MPRGDASGPGARLDAGPMAALASGDMRSLRKFIKELRKIREHTDGRTFLLYTACILASVPELFRTKNLKAADSKMRGKMCVFKIDGEKRLGLDGEYFSGAREIYCRRVYFAASGFDINENDVIIDLGANAGLFTMVAALRGRKVIAVEAQSGFAPIIELNLARSNVLHKATIELGLVGSNSGILSVPSDRQTASHWGVEPPVLSLPDIIGRYNLEHVDFLKVDIEGSEFDLFAHDVDWLSRVEKIAMEVHLDFGDVDDLVKVLKEHGFDVWLVDNEQNLVDHLIGPGGYLFARRTL